MIWLRTKQNKKRIYLFYVYERFACMYVCVPGRCLEHKEAENRASDPIELKLRMVVCWWRWVKEFHANSKIYQLYFLYYKG